MDARKQVLTATDFITLKSSISKASKASLEGETLLPAFAGVWMEKHSDPVLGEEDLWSYGPAARGHIIEPYAVDVYAKLTGKKFHHWDDVVVCDNGLGFSPDAVLNMKCPEPGAFNAQEFTVQEILEVKCYSAENHGKAIATKPSGYKERYQIAWAMYVCPYIKYGTLLFYNPSAAVKIHTVRYHRDDLQKEIELCAQVADIYRKTDEKLSLLAKNSGDLKVKDELAIWAEAMR